MNGEDPRSFADLREQAIAIETWSGRVRVLRDPHGSAGESVSDLLREELGVAEEELRAQHDELVSARVVAELEREQYRQLFDSAPVPYIITDSVGTIQAPNTAAAALMGMESGRLTGKPLAVFVEPSARPEFRARINAIAASGDATETMRVRFVSRENERHEAICVIGVVRDRELRATDLRWLIVPESIALRAERERLLRESELARIAAEDASRAKTELLATVSHELRTPLTAIGGYGELLAMGLRGTLKPEQLEDVERIRRAQQHMSTLLDDLLLYFRLGLGGLSATVTTATVNDIVSGLVAFVAPQANGRRIALAIDAPDIPGKVLADVDRGRQILINLLTNAVKFSPSEGRVDMRIIDGLEYVTIKVQDQGSGIPPDRLDSIFEPFVQLDAGTASRGGFGLGLAISRKLAELMGGSLRARSSPGAGSCFALALRKAP